MLGSRGDVGGQPSVPLSPWRRHPWPSPSVQRRFRCSWLVEPTRGRDRLAGVLPGGCDHPVARDGQALRADDPLGDRAGETERRADRQHLVADLGRDGGEGRDSRFTASTMMTATSVAGSVPTTVATGSAREWRRPRVSRRCDRDATTPVQSTRARVVTAGQRPPRRARHRGPRRPTQAPCAVVSASLQRVSAGVQVP